MIWYHGAASSTIRGGWKGRKTPRGDRHGLPNVTTRIGFELEPHENDLVVKALRKAKLEMGASLGDAAIELKDALLYLARQFLESDPANGVGRVERDDPLYTILYHSCPDCGKAHLPTPEGLVEIPGDVVDAIEAEAKKVTITPQEELPGGPAGATSKPVPIEERDRPNTPVIVKKVLLREGQVCANPMCGAKLGLHAHHIQFRVNGGKTELWNEVCCCARCHSLLHASLLRIEVDPVKGLVWKTKCAENDFAFGEELARAGAIAQVHVTPTYGLGPAESTVSTRVETERAHMDEALIRALVKVGYAKEDAVRRIAAAHRAVAARSLEANEQNLLAAALRAA